ncbi:hypothetical protein KL939_002920 [Ogataea angusta]|nr:hypothetical protein KL939_002920 [Ogataea angusta]
MPLPGNQIELNHDIIYDYLISTKKDINLETGGPEARQRPTHIDSISSRGTGTESSFRVLSKNACLSPKKPLKIEQTLYSVPVAMESVIPLPPKTSPFNKELWSPSNESDRYIELQVLINYKRFHSE